MSGILVVQEARKGGNSRYFQETLAAGRLLVGLTGLPVDAAAIGDSNRDVFVEIQGPPPVAAYAIQHPLLETYTSDGYVLAFEQLIRRLQPDYIVFPHSYQVRDFVPRLATRFGQVLLSGITAIEAGPTFVRQLFQGKMNAVYSHQGDGPCFLSIQAGAFRADSNSGGTFTIYPFLPEIATQAIRAKPGEPFRTSAQTVDLASAQRIVSVGRGIQDAANLPLVHELAAALGAELAASRPVCDAGWLSSDHQVGSSGQCVSPKLYLALGISGAIQHQVGMNGSQCIAAINKDPDAPIFEVADYGIHGDLFEVVPALIEALKAAQKP